MISIGQATAKLGSAVSLCVMPPGPCHLVLGSDPASTGAAYIGITPATAAGSFTSTNGFPLAVGASVSLTGYPSDGGASLSVVAAGTATVGWIVSRP
jgi:hypothetical protein